MSDQPDELDQYAYLWDGSEPGWMLVTFPGTGDSIVNRLRIKCLRIKDTSLHSRVCERMKAAGCEVRVVKPSECEQCGESATLHMTEIDRGTGEATETFLREARENIWHSSDLPPALGATTLEPPQEWEDLRKPYETCVLRSGRPWSFEELRDRVEVDWGADAKSRLTTNQTTRVIWLRDGTDAYWESHEPNRLVREYLKSGK